MGSGFMFGKIIMVEMYFQFDLWMICEKECGLLQINAKFVKFWSGMFIYNAITFIHHCVMFSINLVTCLSHVYIHITFSPEATQLQFVCIMVRWKLGKFCGVWKVKTLLGYMMTGALLLVMFDESWMVHLGVFWWVSAFYISMFQEIQDDIWRCFKRWNMCTIWINIKQYHFSFCEA